MSASSDQQGAGGDVRTIAIVGPFTSGKTTLLEAILTHTGALEQQGRVDAGTSVGDGSPEARAHGMSVEANVADATFLGDTYTFIDCPGSVEFVSDATSVLAGVDAAIVVCEADDKKLPALQVVLKRLEDLNIPRFIFLNKIDKSEGGVRESLEMLQGASETPLVLRQIPIWKEGIAVGFIDLALERAHVYREHMASEVIDMTNEDRKREMDARYSMLETLADHDDVLMEQLIEEIDPSQDQVFEDLRGELRAGIITPVFIGSAANGNGILRLLKALRHEAPGVSQTVARLAGGELAQGTGLVLKTMHTTHGGKLSLVRVLSGRISEGDTLYNGDGESGRVSAVFRVRGQKADKVKHADAGDTVALAKVDGAATGDTLSRTKDPAQLIPMPIPQPVMARAVSVSNRKDEVKLTMAMQKVAEEDPTLVVGHHQDTGEYLLSGQGEMHLRVALERLKGKFALDVNPQIPSVPYKETIKRAVTQRGRHKKQSGGHGQFGDVVLDIKPLPRGEGFRFDETISGGVVPKQYIASVEAGVRDTLQSGPLGFPVVDIAVTLTDGSHHSVDSSDQAFRAAGWLAASQGLAEASPVLLEPISQVSIHVPNAATPKVNAIISSRRGQILGFEPRAGWHGWDTVKALMPESEIGDLIIELRSASAGAAVLEQAFDHYAELTGKLAQNVLRRTGSEAA